MKTYKILDSACWPEWADYNKVPEYMEVEEYKIAVLTILRTKEDVQWEDTIANLIEEALANFYQLEQAQAKFINKHR